MISVQIELYLLRDLATFVIMGTLRESEDAVRRLLRLVP